MKRFQARHGIPVDGHGRRFDFRRAECPGAGPPEPARHQSDAHQDADREDSRALRHGQHSGGPGRGGRDGEGGLAPHRDRRQGRPAVADRQQRDLRDQLQSLLDGAGEHHQEGSHSEDADRSELPDRVSHPHLRPAGQRIAAEPGQLEHRRSHELHVSAGPGRQQFARHRSRSISRARTACTCTTRRTRDFSTTSSASIPRAASASRTFAN